MKTMIHALALVVSTLAASSAQALPDVVTYAARVENDAGVFSGTVSVTFQLFAASSAGTELWSENVASAVVVGGDLVHDLGSIEPLDDTVLNRNDLFLSVTINGDTLEPRVALRAVPYALKAREAESLAGLSADDVATDVEVAAAVAARVIAFAQLSGVPAGFADGVDNDTIFSVVVGGGLVQVGNEFGIANNAINSARIADGSVSAADIAANAIDSARITDGSVVSADIADGAISSADINDATISSADLAANSVESSEIANNAVGSSEIADNAVGSSEIGDNAVFSQHLTNFAVENSDLDNDAVNSEKIVGNEVIVFKFPSVCDNSNTLTLELSCEPRLCSASPLRFLECNGSCTRLSQGFCPTIKVGSVLGANFN